MKRERQSARQALLRAGQHSFSTLGFEAASLAGIVADADVTTGSLYHHFKDKKALFHAVAEQMEQDFLRDVVRAVPPEASRWDQLIAGLHATLELSAEPGLQRILFIDAPTVIGAAEWREIQLKYGCGLVRASIEALLRDGVICKEAGAMASQMLVGALMEGAQLVATAQDKAHALEQAKATLNAFLSGLKV